MVEIIWTDPALDDLDQIAEHIAIDKLSAARQLVSRVFERVDRLTEQPNSGRKIPELTPSRYREVTVGPCRTFYRVSAKKVYILCVLRAELELRRYLLEERGDN